MTERVLIVGAAGQLGGELQRCPWAGREVVALDRSGLDVTDRSQVMPTLAHHRPQVIINTAGYTAVDRAESEPDRASAVNHRAVSYLAEGAAELDSWLIHFSTDYVFDGTKPGWYREDDATNPLGVYGRTKLEGEASALQWERALVVRTSWLYSSRGTNFVKTIRRLAGTRDRLTVVADQVGTPSSAREVAGIIESLISGRELRAGLYHLAAPDDASWYEFASQIVSLSGMDHRVEVVPIATDEYPTAARRPANSRLDSERFALDFGRRLRPWRQGLSEVIDQLDQASQSLVNIGRNSKERS